MCLILAYVGDTHIGAQEHAFSKETLLVLVLAVVLFCIGIDSQGIWHRLTTIGP